MIGRTVSHYKILEQLGAGGMGVVYRAVDTLLDRPVALKFLPPELTRDPGARQRFTQEARAASSLDHPNICTIHDIAETDDGQVFIVMAYYEGETLRQRLNRGPLESEEALRIVRQVAEGLSQAHQHGIVHRDIKPANIILTPQGTVKILDFGLAKLSGQTALTKVGTTVGTVAYMSPEQARGNPVDHRTDIWSLGAVLYEGLTGRTPFRGDFDQAVLYAILNDDPPPIDPNTRNIPASLAHAVQRCLDKNPEKRPQSIAGFLTLLPSHASRTNREWFSRQAVRFAHLRSWITRTPSRVGWTVAAVLLAALVGLAWLRLGREATTARRVAVLPFETPGREDEAFLGNGITEAITTRLAVISGLGVISRQSVEQYRGTSKSSHLIGEELGADFILSGTVRLTGTGSARRVRVIPQLVRVTDDTYLWTHTYEEEYQELLSIETAIAERVAQALDMTLLAPERERLKRQSAAAVASYEHYLRGAELLRKPWTERNISGAIAELREALRTDPNFALAEALLSQAHLRAYAEYIDRSQPRLDSARAAAERALALNPDLAEAHAAMGSYYYRGLKEYPLALEEYTEALQRQPGNGELVAGIGYVLRRQGDMKGSADRMLQACALNPRDHLARYDLAMTQLVRGDYAEAERSFDATIALAPDWSPAYMFKALLYMSWRGDTLAAQDVLTTAVQRIGARQLVCEMTYAGGDALFRYASLMLLDTLASLTLTESGGDPASYYLAKAQAFDRLDNSSSSRAYLDSARVALESLVLTHPDEPLYHAQLGSVYAETGRRDEAIREGQTAMRLQPVEKDVWDGLDYVWTMASIYQLTGDNDDALREIRRALRYPGMISRAWLRTDRSWQRLRSDPRFKKILAEG